MTNPTAPACNKDPVVKEPGVVTILFTMQQIRQSAASLILANAIKYASPVASPKILFLKDSATNGEDEGDPDYIKNVLLKGYNVTYSIIVSGGLSASATTGYDVIMVSNPGHPLGDRKTAETLLAYKGGVILIGDDMAQGGGGLMSSLTGLKFINNGTSVSCGNGTFQIDNDVTDYKYQISMNEEFLPGIPDADKNYTYGNDIDHTETVSSMNVQILAWAAAPPNTCNIGKIPAVVRHSK